MPQKNEGQTKTAIYPGTFDPITNGHLSLIQRATNLFDHIVVAVAKNAGKDPFFSHDERFELVRASLEELTRVNQVEVIQFDGLLANLAKKLKACAIIRGLRAVSDFEFEFQMALMNRKMARNVETVFLMPALSWVYLSSTIVKDVAAHNGEIHTLVPPPVKAALLKKYKISR
ncbi:MAG: pantetheine-phosphate adenylyltransferase [Candidatus Zixiibacteriota bacterium]|nr:MAG: pantetheine-phosphate adenylyltransferase [candidate division Zixibacteria bacterium]HDL02513.1 pantetheine-phosphate adenylyltransferase [candidate division Zixibacteria bacterium]